MGNQSYIKVILREAIMKLFKFYPNLEVMELQVQIKKYLKRTIVIKVLNMMVNKRLEPHLNNKRNSPKIHHIL